VPDIAAVAPPEDQPVVATLPPPLPRDAEPARPRKGRLGRTLLLLGVAAVLILGFAILAAWARSGYYVAFDDDDTVAIYQGRHDGFLWFEPTRERPGPFTREQLDEQSISLVEQEIGFESEADAARFIATSLSATTTTTSTTTTTTTTSTTTIPPTTPVTTLVAAPTTGG
jgi:hypothetical protein